MALVGQDVVVHPVSASEQPNPGIGPGIARLHGAIPVDDRLGQPTTEAVGVEVHHRRRSGQGVEHAVLKPHAGQRQVGPAQPDPGVAGEDHAVDRFGNDRDRAE